MVEAMDTVAGRFLVSHNSHVGVLASELVADIDKLWEIMSLASNGQFLKTHPPSTASTTGHGGSMGELGEMPWLKAFGHYPLGALIASHVETLLWRGWEESKSEKKRVGGQGGAAEMDRFLSGSLRLRDLAFHHVEGKVSRHRLLLKSWAQAVKTTLITSLSGIRAASSSSSSSLNCIDDLRRLYTGLATISNCHARSQHCILVDHSFVCQAEGASYSLLPSLTWLDNSEAFVELVCTTPLPLVGTIHADVRSRLMEVLQEARATVFEDQLLMSLCEEAVVPSTQIGPTPRKARRKKKKRGPHKPEPSEPPIASGEEEEMVGTEPEQDMVAEKEETVYLAGDKLLLAGEVLPLPVVEEADEEDDGEGISVERLEMVPSPQAETAQSSLQDSSDGKDEELTARDPICQSDESSPASPIISPDQHNYPVNDADDDDKIRCVWL